MKTKKKKQKTIRHQTWKRTWKGSKESYMQFYHVENNTPRHDVIGYEYKFMKKAKSPVGSIYQQTVLQSGEVTLEEAMTIINGLSEAVLLYIFKKEEETKKRFY